MKRGLTLSAAQQQGIRALKLPLHLLASTDDEDEASDKHAFKPQLKHRVLNIDTVVQTFVHVNENGGDWKAALQQALPARKGGLSVG